MSFGFEDQGALERLRTGLVSMRLDLSLLRVYLALKAGFRSNQPRVPAGSPDGGQWTDEYVIFVGGRGRAGSGPVRIGTRWVNITPAQQARLAISRNEMRAALKAVRKIDPNWKPQAQAYATVEGQITANYNVARDARFRIFELERTPVGPGQFAREWIEAAPSNRRPNNSERQEINRMGRKWGCHRCGDKDPKTKSGNFIGDHQIPRSMGHSTRIYPHCLACSLSQGGLVSGRLRRK